MKSSETSSPPFRLADLPSRGSIGVFAANDDRARNFKSRLRKTGLRIPQDIALISADDTPFAHQNALSSIRIDFERGGYYAAEMLDARLNPGRAHRTHAVFGDLCVMRRESTRHFAHSLSGIPAAMALIRSRACEGLTVAEVLACIGGSRRTAEITFRTSTGHTIHEEITSLRLERIFSLLEDTSRPLGSFPDFCGFRTPQALRKAFRKRTGLSMLEWRNRLMLIPGKT